MLHFPHVDNLVENVQNSGTAKGFGKINRFFRLWILHGKICKTG